MPSASRRRSWTQVAALNAAGAGVKVITDDLDMARAIAAHPGPLQALIEVDCGEVRGGIPPDSPALDAIAAALRPRFAGVMTHAGHCYYGRSRRHMAAIAEAERSAASARRAPTAARRGWPCPSSRSAVRPPRCMRGGLDGVTECGPASTCSATCSRRRSAPMRSGAIAVTVLASVIGRQSRRERPAAGCRRLALSKDRSTEAAPHDYGFGLVLDRAGRRDARRGDRRPRLPGARRGPRRCAAADAAARRPGCASRPTTPA